MTTVAATLLALSCAGHASAQEPEPSWWDSTQQSLKQTTNFLTGRERLDANRGRELYQQGDELFRRAAGASPTARDAEEEKRYKKDFADAAKFFKRAHEADPDSALGQDSLFMQAESLFFSDQLIKATDVYQTLQKDFPRNRHGDQIAARLFSITQYWIDTEKSGDNDWVPINLFDPTRPRLDTDGHAVRVLDQIRYDDPTGRLADDATMAAAAEYIRQGKYEMADEFLTDLRDTFPDSEHYFLAHLMGIRCKMEVYAGPKYSNLLLEEADKLVQQTRQRFPDKLRESQYSEMLAKAAAEVSFRRAEHLLGRAKYREKRREFRAAGEYYQELLDKHSDTPFADEARKGLQRTAAKPPVPAQRLTWLRNLFPDERSSSPLEMTFESPTGEKRNSILR